LLALFYQKYKKISSFIVAFTCLLLVLLEWVLLRTPSCVILLAPKTMILSALLSRHLLLRQIFMRQIFYSASSDDAATYLNNFIELCEMQKYKNVDGNIIKLKLFPFSLRERAKDWLLSLPRNHIDSWDKCKDAFIRKYYPPTKIIALRSDIMKFRQFDNKHVAQAWERMKECAIQRRLIFDMACGGGCQTDRYLLFTFSVKSHCRAMTTPHVQNIGTSLS
jgi:hypothetical protein